MSKSEILKQNNSINKKAVNKYIVEDGGHYYLSFK